LLAFPLHFTHFPFRRVFPEAAATATIATTIAAATAAQLVKQKCVYAMFDRLNLLLAINLRILFILLFLMLNILYLYVFLAIF